MGELLDYLIHNDENFRRARLPALYSDFSSQRTLNPDGYNANVRAWKQGLSKALLSGHAPTKSPARNHLTLELDDSLLRSLETKQFGRPLALGLVLQEALASGEMMPLRQFLQAQQSIYHKPWSSIPWSIVSWGLRQAGLARGPSDSIPKGQFIVLQNVEEAAKAFAAAAADRNSPFDLTFSKAQFRRTFESNLVAGEHLSETDLDALLKFLSRDKGLLVTDGNTIKIRTAAATTDAQSVTITEEDSAIASLKELMEDLIHQTDLLSKRIDELNVAAQDAVRRKNRVSALAALKSKKLAETNLATRHATLNQLEEVAAKIEQASDNAQLVRVMQSSTLALRNLNAQTGGADKVDEVLDSLREQMGEVDEIGNIIAETGPTATAVNEGEVDDEFEAMLADERKKEEEAERIKQEAKDAKETRQKLEELDKLGPIPSGQPQGEALPVEKRALTPVSAAASELEDMHIGEENTGMIAEVAE